MQALADVLWQLLTNPNIAFTLLVLGLWMAVLAVSAPGSGAPETAAVIFLALAAVGLLNLPVSAVGLGLIVLSMILFFAEVRFYSHGALMLAGAVVMGVGGLLLFPATDRSPDQLSLFTIVAAPVLTTVLFGFLIRMGLSAQKAPPLQDLRRLVGAPGVSRTEVGREGTVYVAGEEWSATADTRIPPDTDVVVIARNGLRLKVAPAARAPAPAAASATHSSTGPA
jgi:membrane-bound serine protease (ClpP class)